MKWAVYGQGQGETGAEADESHFQRGLTGEADSRAYPRDPSSGGRTPGGWGRRHWGGGRQVEQDRLETDKRYRSQPWQSPAQNLPWSCHMETSRHRQPSHLPWLMALRPALLEFLYPTSHVLTPTSVRPHSPSSVSGSSSGHQDHNPLCQRARREWGQWLALARITRTSGGSRSAGRGSQEGLRCLPRGKNK